MSEDKSGAGKERGNPRLFTAKAGKQQRFDKDPLPDKIGQSLRQIYDDVLNEEIPDDFLSLLRTADDKSADSGGEAS